MPAVTCVLHHHIGAESAFERQLGVTTAPEMYEAQIDWIARNYDLIDLDTLLSGKLPKRPMLLTFDDAFRSVRDVARSVLAPRGIKSVFFVNAGLIGGNEISLDSTLTWAAGEVGLDQLCDLIGVPRRDTIGQLVVGDMAAFGAAERAGIKAKVLAAFGPPDLTARAPLLSAEDLRELPGLGVEIGNHTMTHVHCRALSSAEIEREVVEARTQLEALSGTGVRSFSVPYGHEKDLTPEMLKALRASGHEAIFLVHARSNRHRPAPDIWYRTSLRNERPGELKKMLKYLPLLRTVKQLARG